MLGRFMRDSAENVDRCRKLVESPFRLRQDALRPKPENEDDQRPDDDEPAAEYKVRKTGDRRDESTAFEQKDGHEQRTQYRAPIVRSAADKQRGPYGECRRA